MKSTASALAKHRKAQGGSAGRSFNAFTFGIPGMPNLAGLSNAFPTFTRPLGFADGGAVSNDALEDAIIAEALRIAGRRPTDLSDLRPRVGAGKYGLPYIPPLSHQAPGELRSANTPLGDYVAERTGITALGPITGAMERVGRATGEAAAGLSGIPWAVEVGTNLGRSLADWQHGGGGGGFFPRAHAAEPSPARLSSAPAPASAPDRLQQLIDQRKSLDAQRALATKERDDELRGKEGKKAGRGPAYDAKNAEVNRLSSEMERLDGMIAEETRRQSPEYAAEMEKLSEAEAVRRQMLAEAPKPFDQWAPNWARVQPWLPFLTALGVTGTTATADALLRRVPGARKWREAVEAGLSTKSPATRQQMADLSTGYEKSFPKRSWAYPAAAGFGAVEGGALSNAPEIYNSFLPAVNPERTAYEEYIKRLPAGHPEIERARELLKTIPERTLAREAALDYFASPAFYKRTGLGTIEGIAGALTGTKVAKSLFDPVMPRPEAFALGQKLARDQERTPRGGGSPRLPAPVREQQGRDPTVPGTALRASPAPSTTPSAALSSPAEKHWVRSKSGRTWHDASTGHFGAGPRKDVGAKRGKRKVLDDDLPERSYGGVVDAALRIARADGGATSLESLMRGAAEGATFGLGENMGLLSEERQAAARDASPWTYRAGEMVGTALPMAALSGVAAPLAAVRGAGLAAQGARALGKLIPTGSAAAALSRALGRTPEGGEYGDPVIDAGLRIARDSGGRVGALKGATGGRADKVPINVPAGSYVLPADFVAALGQHNTTAGQKVLEGMFGRGSRYAKGGSVPILASDGEFVLAPEQVAAIGRGDHELGSAILDRWVVEMRKKSIKQLAALPPPAGSSVRAE